MFRRYSLLDSSPPSASVSIIPHRPRRRRHQSVTHEMVASAPSLTKPPSPKNTIIKPANSMVLFSNRSTTSTSPSWYARWGSSLRKNLLRRGLSVSMHSLACYVKSGFRKLTSIMREPFHANARICQERCALQLRYSFPAYTQFGQRIFLIESVTGVWNDFQRSIFLLVYYGCYRNIWLCAKKQFVCT